MLMRLLSESVKTILKNQKVKRAAKLGDRL